MTKPALHAVQDVRKPPMNAESILAILRPLAPELRRRFKAKDLGLFGSFARTEQSSSSDVDVLVDFEEGADLFDLVGLAQFLEERLARRVDVVPRRALRAELRDKVLREVLPLGKMLASTCGTS